LLSLCYKSSLLLTYYIRINITSSKNHQVNYSPIYKIVNTQNSDEPLGVKNVVTTIEREEVLARDWTPFRGAGHVSLSTHFIPSSRSRLRVASVLA